MAKDTKKFDAAEAAGGKTLGGEVTCGLTYRMGDLGFAAPLLPRSFEASPLLAAQVSLPSASPEIRATACASVEIAGLKS